MSDLHFPIEIDLDELAGRDWHPVESELFGYVRGNLDELDRDCIGFHIDECGSCFARLSTIEAVSVPATRLPVYPGFAGWAFEGWKLSAAYGTAVVLIAVGLISISLVLNRADVGPMTETGHSMQSVRPRGSLTNGGESGSRAMDGSDLLAANLVMPGVIAEFDRTARPAVRGTHPSLDTFSIIGPLATIVSVDRPVFSWTPLEGVESYTVSVYDGELRLLKASEPMKETRWVIPVRLKAGVTYTWIVSAMKGGEERLAPLPPSRAEFRIMGRRDYERLKRDLARTTSHRARGVLYARAGMLDEAERELSLHIRLVPSDQRSKKLLAKVRSWRRL